jgi:hypothetical protein
MYYLSILAIFKNETMNLKVWLEHYLWQGVKHFYLIDNDSDDSPLSILQEYIDKGIVSYYFLPEKHKQEQHYRYVFDKADLKNNTYWLAVCDLDEFFYGVDKKLSIKLRSLESYFDYVSCNWLMFGSDGLVQHPPDIRTAITHREKDLHLLTKYIFKTSVIANSSQIHIHSLTNLSYIDKKRIRIANQLIKLNHYPIQSLEFFEKVKMTRGAADTLINVRNIDYFHNYNKNTTYYDDTLKNLILNPPKNYSNQFIHT